MKPVRCPAAVSLARGGFEGAGLPRGTALPKDQPEEGPGWGGLGMLRQAWKPSPCHMPAADLLGLEQFV